MSSASRTSKSGSPASPHPTAWRQAGGKYSEEQVTDRGHVMLREGEAIFDELREQWEKRVGADAVEDLERTLKRLLGNDTIRLDKPPGWLVQDLTNDG